MKYLGVIEIIYISIFRILKILKIPKSISTLWGISGIRPDFVDFRTRTIYELKPNNPRQIKASEAQLAKFKAAFEAKYPGTTWQTILDKY